FANQRFSDSCIHTAPDIDDLVVTFIVGDETHVIVVPYFLNLALRILKKFFLDLRDDEVVDAERETTLEGCTESEVLDIIEELRSLRHVRDHDDVADDLTKILLSEEGVYKSNFSRHELIKQYATHSCLNQLMLEQSICIADVGLHLDPCMQVDLAFII